MKLPRSTYYHQTKNPVVDDSELIALIEAIIEEFPGYGYRRVTRELHRRNKIVNHKKILRIMRQRGLTRKPRRRWIKTTDSRHHHRVYPNLIQNLVVTAPIRFGRPTSPILASEAVLSIWPSFWICLPEEPSVTLFRAILIPLCVLPH